MEISQRKPTKRPREPMDEWLRLEGYFRKHAPRDSTCLFRAVSEQVYLTQHYHIRVRKECVEYMRRMRYLFEQYITIPFDDYLDQMACFTQWGGYIEIQAMSMLYERNFVIFSGYNQTDHIGTNSDSKDTIYLCQTSAKQYECIYTRDYVGNAAFCQSIVYKVLYENVFEMDNIEGTVDKMLHDKTATFRHDKFFLKENLEIREQLTTDIYNAENTDNGYDETDDAQGVARSKLGTPPFPYKVAKALDPNIYRNTDFDIWHEIRREVKNAGWTKHNANKLQVGGKCLVQVNFDERNYDKNSNNNNNDCVPSLEKSFDDSIETIGKTDKDPVFYYGHIQEIDKNEGPVLVFIEELGEKRLVPYSALKPLPSKKNRQGNWSPTYKKNLSLDSSTKWKKTYNVKPTKTKITVLPNNVNTNENNNSIISDINKNNISWKEEGTKKVNGESYENFASQDSSSFSAIDNDELSPMGAPKAQSSPIDMGRQEKSRERRERSSFTYNKNLGNNFKRGSKSDSAINNDSNNSIVPFNGYPKERTLEETYYNYTDSENSNVQLLPINCTVQKSVDISGSDLPLSDPLTLRFFYNLGLEYFHNGGNWNYLTNGQSPSFGECYRGTTSNEEISSTTEMMRECTLAQKGQEHESTKTETTRKPVPRETKDAVNNLIQKTEIPKAEDVKDGCNQSSDKVQKFPNKNTYAQSPVRRNGLSPRFKKNAGKRYRPNTDVKVAKGGTKENYRGIRHTNSFPPQIPVPADMMNSYQETHMQQGMYSGLPYYSNEGEAFANPYYPPPSPGYIPMQCLPPTDMPDVNNLQPYLPQPYPGMDYAQAYSGSCPPPYLCNPVPPAMFNVPPQNIPPEHWYAVAGQPHYMPYAPMVPMAPEPNCNGVTQNINQTVPS
ncbi:putative bifunctional UDP-N-acetylglucosamine transferase and deubiquitinase ALG13 isoform X2 [Ceratina calcarata]|uniref:Bifunctional UDP-N-acetylglucosamine transferase and deubiquitinase ALG13 isoform X2 n=1 Tax=Ceratina calcarata TaxID=156304 RepID=A0AAJ7N5T0_9HYME|nr:putative bifunctional UDP-N-acetylglucosamine transferase and deubiquitinase ALG13 isoform X2 [Ceratina calcarata]